MAHFIKVTQCNDEIIYLNIDTVISMKRVKDDTVILVNCPVLSDCNQKYSTSPYRIIVKEPVEEILRMVKVVD